MVVNLTLFFQGGFTMSEKTIQSVRTQSFDPINESDSLRLLPLLAAFIGVRRGIGRTEDELVKESNLSREETLKGVWHLETQGFVRSFINQEGTTGPWARRYKLVDGFKITIELSKPE